MKSLSIFAVAALATLGASGALTFLGAGGAWAQSTTYPATIENCGRTVAFDLAPDRVVSVGQSSTELLYSLGLADKVVGTAVWFNDVLPQFKDANDKIERLTDNDPSFESVVSKRPELVTAQFEWHVGPEGMVGTYAQFDEVGIPTYVMPPDCIGKDNLTGGDGTRSLAFDIETIYRAINEMGTVFDVQGQGAALIEDMKQKQENAIALAKNAASNGLSAVVWFSSPDIKLDAYVAGRNGVPGYMLKTLGIRNVIETDEEWPLVGWETIARANPDVIIIARMDRRRFPADDYEKKLDYLRTDPVASQMDAVRNDRIIIVDAHAIQPSIRIATGLETIAENLKTMGLTE